MKKNRHLLSSALLTLLALSSANAMASLVSYNFTSSGVAQYAPSSTATFVSATNIGNTGSNASQATAITGSLAINPASGAISAASAVTNNSYFEFTASANSGYYLNLTDISFLEAARAANKDGWVIRSSIDGFSSDIQSHILTSAYPSFVSSPIVSLVASSYQHLLSIKFRIYTFATDGISPAVAYKNLVLNGTVSTINSVPAPTTIMLLAFGLAGFSIVRMKSDNGFGRKSPQFWR